MILNLPNQGVFFSVKHTFNLGLDFNWVIGLTSLELYTAIPNLTEENNKFEFYSDSCDEFSFVEMKVELEETPSISDITPSQVQHEVLGPRIVQAYNKLGSETSSSDSYLILLMDYARSPFRDFENYLSIVVGLDEVGIQLIFIQCNS